MKYSFKIARYALWMCVSIILSTLSAHSQDMDRISVAVDDGLFAKNHRNHMAIHGQRFVFSEPVFRFAPDSIAETILVQLRGKTKDDRYNSTGYVMQYRPGMPHALWATKINYSGEDIFYVKDVLLHEDHRGTKRLVPLNGKQHWWAKNSVIAVDEELEVIIGYPRNASGKSAHLLTGYDLRNGTMRWKRTIDRSEGWSDMKYLNDSTILISASGLHTIDLNTGRGWDFRMETVRMNYGAGPALTGVGRVGDQRLGTFGGSSRTDIVLGIASDALFDSTAIYIADHSRLVRLDHGAQEVWSSLLPHDKTSHMKLLRMGGLVVVVNLGYAYQYIYEIPFGNAFLAAFDAQTGEQVFFNFLSPAPNQRLEQAIPLDDHRLRLVYSNHIVDASVAEGGKEIVSHAIDAGSYGNLLGLVGEDVFLKPDTVLVPLAKTDSTGIFVATDRETVLHITPDKRVANVFAMEDLFLKIYEFNDHSFMSNRGTIWMFDPSGRVAAEFPEADEIGIFGGKGYVSRHDELWVFDSDQLFPE